MNEKGKLIAFRLTNNEQLLLNLMAAEEGRNISEQLRELIREGAGKRGLPAAGLISTVKGDAKGKIE